MKNLTMPFLELARKIPLYIKKLYKYKKFEKYAVIGKNLSISPMADCEAEAPGYITIGDNCEIFGKLESQGSGRIFIGNNTAIYNRSVVGSVKDTYIGNCVIISNHVHIYDNNNHPTDPEARREKSMGGFHGKAWRWTNSKSKPIVIEDNVWIGEYSAILKGVTVGEGSVVASHAVFTKNVPPYSIVAGNPAAVVKDLRHEK